MLEQWVIEQLNPLKGEKLIIIADPQRMIRTGAPVPVLQRLVVACAT